MTINFCIKKINYFFKQNSAFFLVLAAILSCQRSTDQNSEAQKLRFNGKQLSEKMRTLNGETPPDNELCFAAEISGPGIEEENINSTCGLTVGKFAGFVKPDQEIVFDVPKGKDRVLELYAQRRPAGGSCDDYKVAAQSPVNLKRIYKVASIPGIDLSADNLSIDVAPVFPGIKNSVFNSKSWPSECYRAANPKKAGMKLIVARSGVTTDRGTVKLKIASKGVLE